MRTSIATVCLSGSLTEKLHACAAAGFDGVEVMDTDLTVAYESPEEIRALSERLGLAIYMFQPLRDIEGVEPELFVDNLRRAEAKFELMRRLGTDLVLVCSNAGTATVDDDAEAASQLGRLADLAAQYGIRIAYEALAWGRFVNDYRHAWRLVTMADRPNLGTCLDSFHILARGHDPSQIEEIDGRRSSSSSWRTHLCSIWTSSPGAGTIASFPAREGSGSPHCSATSCALSYTGPISLEVFNDTYRQTDVRSTAAHARRSLTWLADQASAAHGWDADRLPEVPSPSPSTSPRSRVLTSPLWTRPSIIWASPSGARIRPSRSACGLGAMRASSSTSRAMGRSRSSAGSG